MVGNDVLSPCEARELARDTHVRFFPMLMGYRFLFGSFLVTDLPGESVIDGSWEPPPIERITVA